MIIMVALTGVAGMIAAALACNADDQAATARHETTVVRAAIPVAARTAATLRAKHRRR